MASHGRVFAMYEKGGRKGRREGKEEGRGAQLFRGIIWATVRYLLVIGLEPAACHGKR